MDLTSRSIPIQTPQKLIKCKSILVPTYLLAFHQITVLHSGGGEGTGYKGSLVSQQTKDPMDGILSVLTVFKRAYSNL